MNEQPRKSIRPSFGGHPENDRTLWPDSFEAHRQSFVESLRVRSYSPKTLSAYGNSLGVFFGFLASTGTEGLPLDDLREVNRETVAAYQLWLGEKGYTTWTVHARLQALRRFFEHLESTHAILLSPCEGLKLPPLKDRLPRRVLSKGEARAILQAPDTGTPRGIRDRAMLELFYSTGIRLEEMSRLTVHDVDVRGGFVRINQGKNARDRVVPMGSSACDYVREYLKQVRAVWSRSNREERALWLSSARPHGALKPQIIAVMVRGYAKAAGIERLVSPHVWRHTCATHLVSGGANIAYVQRLLGHRRLDTTQIYSRVAIPEVQQTHRKAHPRQKTKAAKAQEAPKKAAGKVKGTKVARAKAANARRSSTR